MIGTTELAKQFSREEIIDKIDSFGLREYGVYHDKVSDRWKALLQKKTSDRPNPSLIVSLNNNDTHRIMLDYIKNDPKMVLKGMQITSYVLDIQELYLYLPEQETQLGSQIEDMAEAKGIQIIYSDFVDRRQYEEGVFHHIGTMAAVAGVFTEGYEPKVFLSIEQGEGCCDTQYISYGMKLSELISTNQGEIKGIEIGSKLYDTSVLDTAIDLDFPLGNGIITILSNGSCIIHEAEVRLETTRKLTCGKCTFCREGILQLHEMMKDISKGKGNPDNLSLMAEISEAIPDGSLCSIGQTGAAFLLESLKNFPSEYEDHIKRKKCASNVCTAFTSIYIDPELCTGCEECIEVCPVDCIEGRSGYIHIIDETECTKCGKCMEACADEAIKLATGRIPKLPDRLIKCGKFKKHQ